MKQFLTDISVNRVANLSLPVSGSDAANKNYVDSKPTGSIVYSIVAPASSVTELMRIPYSSVRSIQGVIDIQNPYTYGKSYNIIARKMGPEVVYTSSNVIGSDTGITVNFIIDGADIVAQVTNTYASANIPVYLRVTV